MLLEDFRKGLMRGKAHLPSRATRVIEVFQARVAYALVSISSGLFASEAFLGQEMVVSRAQSLEITSTSKF